MKDLLYDCIIIGAGPAGLTAGIYLARFRRKFLIFSNGQSRAKLIYRSHNYPGAKRGISGTRLLFNLSQQLSRYNVSIIPANVFSINKQGKHFLVKTKHAKYLTKHVILATGCCDIEPKLPRLKNAIKKGLIRHCGVCDAYEVRDREIGIIGVGEKVVNEALFLRQYTTKITVFNYPDTNFKPSRKKLLKQAGVVVVEEPIIKVKIVKSRLSAFVTAKNIYHFDSIYSALGSIVRTDLVKHFQLKKNEEGYLLVNKFQETSSKNLFAIGDVVASLSQICVATGQAAIAACAINKRLNNEYKKQLSCHSPPSVS